MATTPTQIRIDSHVKKQAMALFNNLGLDMSSAVNLFLHQCVLRRGAAVSCRNAKGFLLPEYFRRDGRGEADFP